MIDLLLLIGLCFLGALVAGAVVAGIHYLSQASSGSPLKLSALRSRWESAASAARRLRVSPRLLISLWLGALLVLVLFPPWSRLVGQPSQSYADGHHALLAPPGRIGGWERGVYRIDTPRLVLEGLAITIAAGIGSAVLLRRQP